MSSVEDAEPVDFGVDLSITEAEVTEVVKKLHGGRATGVDEIRPEFILRCDVVGLSWLTRLCSKGQYLWIGGLGWWSPSLKRGTRGCVPVTGESHSSASLIRSMQDSWRRESDRLTNLGSRRNNVPSWSWNTGPALHPH